MKNNDAYHKPLHVDAHAITVWRIETIFGALIFGLAVIAATQFIPFLSGLGSFQLAILVILAIYTVFDYVIIVPLRFKYYTYTTNKRNLVIHKGRLIRRETTVPIRKIIYIRIVSNPLLRYLKVVKIEFGTVGEPIALGPLGETEAQALKEQLDMLIGDAHDAR